MTTMPFKLIVMADLGAAGDAERVPLERDGLGALFERLRPQLALTAPSRLGGGADLSLEIEPRSLEDFDPPALLARLLEPARRAAAGGDAAAVSEQLDEIVHHPGFARLESAWRGLGLLAARAGVGVAVEVVRAPRASLASVFREVVFRPEYDGIPADPASLVLVDHDVTHRAADIEVLREIGGLAKAIQVPVVFAAGAEFFEFKNLVHALALPDLPSRLTGPSYSGWMSFQREEAARWVSVTVNRFLLRAPHAIERDGFAYREREEAAHPEWYCWGRPVWLAGLAAMRSQTEKGHPTAISGLRDGGFTDLPARGYPRTREETVELCSEVPIDDMKAREIAGLGLAPLVGELRGRRAFFPLLANAYRFRPGMLTVESSLAYQLLAGRLAQFCSRAVEDAVASSDEEAAGILRGEIHRFLGALAGPDPATSVEVTVSTSPDAGGPAERLAHVRVRPAMAVEGKPVDLQFVLKVG